tara:strand:+ start:16 stop:372 length:357 start_codon:yes stop_codon:yes gene_type:complete
LEELGGERLLIGIVDGWKKDTEDLPGTKRGTANGVRGYRTSDGYEHQSPFVMPDDLDDQEWVLKMRRRHLEGSGWSHRPELTQNGFKYHCECLQWSLQWCSSTLYRHPCAVSGPLGRS